MEFNIILHGKPNAGSHKVIGRLDNTFCDNIVKQFFQSMNNIKEPEVLIVDARYWKDTWYSVYTFWLGGNIVDTANRVSFLAISVVVPKQYFCLVSAIYDLLRRACQEIVVGTYISKDGKYLVQDFNDDAAFKKISTFINENFVNLGENFDKSFHQTTIDMSNSCYYNILDCDSRAFTEDFKKYGRVFVSKTFESKDKRLSSSNKWLGDLKKTQTALQSKEKEITELKSQKKEIEIELNKKHQLGQKVDLLNKEIESLRLQIDELTQKNTKHKEKEIQIIRLLGIKEEKEEKWKKEKKKEEITSKHNGVDKTNIKVRNIVPLLNTFFLVVILLLVMFVCFKSYESGNPDGEATIEKDTLAEILKNPYTEKNPSFGVELDEDCGLVLYQDGKQITKENIDLRKPLKIVVEKEKQGFQFYTDNLKTNKGEVISGKEFVLERETKDKPIIITYRTSDLKKTNKLNVLTIN